MTKKLRKSSNASLAARFSALSDPTRVRLLHLLLPGEMCVCDLVDIIEVPQPTASRHLGHLRKANLVQTEKRGLWIYYTLAPAKTAFHKALIDCIRVGAKECPVLQEDAKRRRARARQATSCC